MAHYAPRQLREIVEISQETYRHWRKALPPLSKIRGQGACFLHGDLVAVAVVRVMVSDLEMKVRALAPLANDLFETCRTTPWPTLERGRLDFDIHNGRITFALDETPSSSAGLLVSVLLKPITEHIQAHFIGLDEEASQGTLQFPPTPVKGLDEKVDERTLVAPRGVS